MRAPGTWRRSLRTCALAAIAALLLVGCGGGGPAAPTTPVATAAPSVTPTLAGPASYGDWVARQGFGGSSGLNNVRKLAKWVTENKASATPFDLTADQRDIKGLIEWLDAHPATPCWAAFHETMVGRLATLVAEYDRAIVARSAGNAVPDTTADAILSTAQAAFDEPAPSACP
jgi:hypothetical protein